MGPKFLFPSGSLLKREAHSFIVKVSLFDFAAAAAAAAVAAAVSAAAAAAASCKAFLEPIWTHRECTGPNKAPTQSKKNNKKLGPRKKQRIGLFRFVVFSLEAVFSRFFNNFISK